ncbi:hypothetical protein GQ42DRAFT_162731 [Ramicandelaber brevisporus]|nr:hypothetical protein GQ42DRAFT_162731 [Ramicandelaber brevisporus]
MYYQAESPMPQTGGKDEQPKTDFTTIGAQQNDEQFKSFMNAMDTFSPDQLAAIRARIPPAANPAPQVQALTFTQPSATAGFPAMQQPVTTNYRESFEFGTRVNQSSYSGGGGQPSIFGNSILTSGSTISDILAKSAYISAPVDDDLLNIKVVRDRIMRGINVEMLIEAEHRLLYEIFRRKCSKEVLDKVEQHWNKYIPDFPQFIDEIWDFYNLDFELENAKIKIKTKTGYQSLKSLLNSRVRT